MENFTTSNKVIWSAWEETAVFVTNWLTIMSKTLKEAIQNRYLNARISSKGIAFRVPAITTLNFGYTQIACNKQQSSFTLIWKTIPKENSKKWNSTETLTLNNTASLLFGKLVQTYTSSFIRQNKTKNAMNTQSTNTTLLMPAKVSSRPPFGKFHFSSTIL